MNNTEISWMTGEKKLSNPNYRMDVKLPYMVIKCNFSTKPNRADGNVYTEHRAGLCKCKWIPIIHCSIATLLFYIDCAKAHTNFNVTFSL